MRLFFTALAVLVAICAAGPAHAFNNMKDLLEVPFGPAVVGVVKDSTGALLPRVQVVVAEAGRTTTTGPDGKFTLRGLAAGAYHISTLLVGYKPGHVLVTVPQSGDNVSITIVMSANPMRLEAVSVTATATGTDPERVAQATVELSGMSLQRSLSSTLALSLRNEPGISVRYNAAATMPVIRGLTGDRVLMLQDGQRTADLSSSAPDHATTSDPLSAQRVELVRGPASLLYGNNALGGVVNVISNDVPTSVPSRVDGYAAVLSESATPGGSVSMGATIPMGNFWAMNLRGSGHSASQVKVGGGAVLDNTQSRNWNGSFGLGYVGDGATFGVSLNNYDFNYGLAHDPSDDERAHIVGARFGGTARATFNTGAGAMPFIKLDGTYQDYHHDELTEEGVVETAFKLKTQTLTGSAKTQFGTWHGSIGAQFLGKQYSAEGDEALTPAANSNGLGAFFYQEVPLTGGGKADRAVSLQFGGRYDKYSIASKADATKFGPARTVNADSPSGSLGLSIPVGDNLAVSGSYAQAFRAPTVEELFSNAVHNAVGQYQIGDPNLKAEQSRGAEAIIKWVSSHATLSASAYDNKIANYVFPNVTKDTIVEGQSMPLAKFQQGDAHLWGFEGSVQLLATNEIVLNAVGDYVRGSFSDGSGPLPFMPPGHVGGGVRWDNGTFNLGADVRHGFEQTYATGGADIPTDAYTLLNLSTGLNIIVRARVHNLTIRVDNAGDTRYFDATSLIKSFSPNPGRNVAVTYRVMF